MVMRFPRRASLRSRDAFLLLAVLVAAAGIAPRTAASPSDHKFIGLRGRVSDDSGAPLPDARVEITGSREATALTGLDGRFVMNVDLGTLEDLATRPAALELRASLAGYRVRVSGGAPALAIEVRLRSASGTPVLEARSNFGIIADAVLDALSPTGVRTASIQVAFQATRGEDVSTPVRVPEKFSSVPVPEPWVNDVAPPVVAAPSTPSAKPAPAPGEREPGKSAAPPVPSTTPSPSGSGSAPATPPAASAVSPPAPTVTEVAPAEPKARPSRRKSKSKPKRQRTPKPERATPERRETEGPALGAVPLPAPASTNLDRVWQKQEADRQAKAAEAQAIRDSIWAAQQAAGRARKAMMDSVRAMRRAEEDSIRRARFGLPPAAAPAAKPAATKPAAGAPAPAAAKKETPPHEASGDGTGYSRTVTRPSTPSGLQRVEPKADVAIDETASRTERARLEADSCTCRVRGTVELEFHRLLSSSMKVEVSIRELPALRDTIELYMGSPRAFEMRRVPCGRWSLAVRPFSDRPFGVTTPLEVAPFDCRQRGLRQVRIVIAPVRTAH